MAARGALVDRAAMTDRPQTIDTGDVYLRTKGTFVATIAALDAGQLEHAVPATPDWRVRDVLAHVTGLTAELNAQRFPDPADEGAVAWAARIVADRNDRAVADLVDEWDREAPTFAGGLRLFGYEFGSHFVGDLHAHHQDVRQALGLPRDDDPLTVAVSLDHYLGFLGERLSALGWGEVTAATGGEILLVGAGPLRARVEAEPFELLRALSARRSLDQIRALRWSGDTERLLAVLPRVYTGGYTLPGVGLAE